jgi:RHS repeat-associated protein
LAEHHEATGALIREYVWMGWDPVAVIEGGVIYLIRADHIGRPVFATTLAGTKVWSAVYLPFGGVHVTTGAPIDARFPGQWFQTEAGLYQNWMRDYDPTTGRYIEADPLGLIAGANVYGYANQSPMMYVDPNGENPLLVAAILAGAGSVAFDYTWAWLFDECYSWSDAGVSFATGAILGGGGYLWKGVKRAGKEFSHAIPARSFKTTRFGRWLERRGNPYSSLDGNYVSPWTHAMTDYYRRVKGVPADQMWAAPWRYGARVPAWFWGASWGGSGRSSHRPRVWMRVFWRRAVNVGVSPSKFVYPIFVSEKQPQRYRVFDVFSKQSDLVTFSRVPAIGEFIEEKVFDSSGTVMNYFGELGWPLFGRTLKSLCEATILPALLLKALAGQVYFGPKPTGFNELELPEYRAEIFKIILAHVNPREMAELRAVVNRAESFRDVVKALDFWRLHGGVRDEDGHPAERSD